MNQTRTVFFISDGTGLTAESLGRSLLSQFDNLHIEQITLPFLDTVEKARDAVAQINETSINDGQRPIIFSTLIIPAVRNIISQSDALMLDLFDMFIMPLGKELGKSPSKGVGRFHTVSSKYDVRIDAINYALSHDDGGISRELHRADIILIGVSRCGKTPTSLYLALQFGIFAANYPLVPEDFDSDNLPPALIPLRSKLYGLTIQPERLQQIRSERSPNSNYATLKNCRYEIERAAEMMHKARLTCLDVTTMSVEEIASTIVQQTGLKR
jgi:regulator of PEP synthase PpsR (kinase-PPPase family)